MTAPVPSSVPLPPLPVTPSQYSQMASAANGNKGFAAADASTDASDVSLEVDPITPGVVHFFSPPPEPQTSAPDAHITNVGAAPCPAPCTKTNGNNVTTNGANGSNITISTSASSDFPLFASYPPAATTTNNHDNHNNNNGNTFIIQMSPVTPITPITPAIQSVTDYGAHDGLMQPILMNGAPPAATHPLYIPSTINGISNGSIRPRGLSAAATTTSYVSAIAAWRHSTPSGSLMTRTPSEGSLAVSPIAIPLAHTTPNTPLLAPIVTSINGVVVPGTPQPQRMATTAPAELIDLRIKHRFLLRLMKAVHAYGCATHRTESLMRHACEAMGIKGEFCVFPTLMIVSFGAPDGDPAKSITHTFPATGGLNCAKLGEVDDLAQLVGQGGISIEDGEKQLDAIIKTKTHPAWLVFLSFGVSSASSAAIFFGGGWYDVAISFALGLIVGAATLLADKYKGLSQLLEFSTSIFVSFFARVITSYVPDTCYFANLLSSLVWFFPGLSITLSVAEVSAQSLVSGSARFFYAVVVSLQIGFGMALGGGLATWDGKGPSNSCTKAMLSGDWVTAIFFITCAFSFNLLLSASLKQMIPMSMASAVGFTVATLLSKPLGDDTATMMAALCVGLSGSVYARVTGHQPVITTISGILMLVPGSLGVRGVAAFLSDDVVSGMLFGFNMLITGMSITIGLMIARMLVFPSKRLRQTDSYI